MQTGSSELHKREKSHKSGPPMNIEPHQESLSQELDNMNRYSEDEMVSFTPF